ncbi:GNAT family N-acetyltransferase [Mesorhizobium loti]|nr:GNAT family N-acetyltransferase [Mesorhizobium loti]
MVARNGPVTLDTWSSSDVDILERCNTPEAKRYVGGPETPEKLLDRHQRYLDKAIPGEIRMFRISCDGLGAGSIGYWERAWHGGLVYETGWAVVPDLQGRGIAGQAAALLIEVLLGERRHRYLHAFPASDNPASNAICRKLGFELMGECDFEYPPGNMMRSSDWRLDLQA